MRPCAEIDSLTTESWNNPTLPGYFYYRRVHRRRPVNPYTPPTEQPGLRLEKSEPSSDNSMGLSLRLNVPAVDKKKAIDLLIAVCRRRYAAIDAAKVMKRKEDLNMVRKRAGWIGQANGHEWDMECHLMFQRCV